MENFIEKNFEGLTSAFNTPFEMEEKDVELLVNSTEKQIELIEEKKNKLVSNKRELMFGDQSFLEDELRSLIVSTRTMLAKLEGEIKLGSKSSYWDSYAKMSTAITGQLKELRELNVSVIQLGMDQKKIGNDININKRATIVLDANSLWELVNKAKQNSEVNQIDASFTIDEEDK